MVSILVTNIKVWQYYTIEKNEIGGACSADGGGERRVYGFGGET
jgi:hypothetical protein